MCCIDHCCQLRTSKKDHALGVSAMWPVCPERTRAAGPGRAQWTASWGLGEGVLNLHSASLCINFAFRQMPTEASKTIDLTQPFTENLIYGEACNSWQSAGHFCVWTNTAPM